MDKKKLDIDTFGEIIDEFLKNNPVRMVVDLPEGKDIPEIIDNTGMGPVIQFYLLLKALKVCLSEFIEVVNPDKKKVPEMLDAMLEMVRHECLEGKNERK